ncbi:MAG TPA: type II secretion system F family protein [Paucimonas sp.]|nr:type II secretion system F family protein [Paucimonas sp.]
MQFHVRTFHAPSGSVAERTLEAESPDAVRHMLEREGVTALSITFRQRPRFVLRAPAFDVMLFCEELRTLLSSGMSLVEAMDTLCAKGGNDERHAVLQEIRQRLQEGKSLSAALERGRFPFPPLLIASIRASERTSRVDEALEEYIRYHKMGQELRKKLVSAAIYPSLVVGFGMLVCLFMVAYVVPRFAQVYEDFAQSLSISTLLLMKVGRFAGDHIVLLLCCVAAAAAAGAASYRSGALGRIVLRALGKIRVARYYLRLYQLARIYQTMAMLLKGGYTLADAIPLAQGLAFEERLQQQIANARRTVMEGRRLSAAFAENGLTDHVTERLLQVGERSGNLAKVMDIIAHTYRQEFSLFVERATRLTEPVLLMTVGLMIGAIIVLMYMPVFDLVGGM